MPKAQETSSEALKRKSFENSGASSINIRIVIWLGNHTFSTSTLSQITPEILPRRVDPLLVLLDHWFSIQIRKYLTPEIAKKSSML